MSREKYRFINGTKNPQKVFSILSLVQDENRYKRVVESAINHGFDLERCEFVAIDNRQGPEFDGYTWIRPAVLEAKGAYLVFTHDDIEFSDDGYEELHKRLDELEQLDPNWMIAGIAGGAYRSANRTKDVVARITDKSGNGRREGNFPHRVDAVDECFFIMKRDRFVVPSIDLSGFHFFASDLCLLAEVMGGTAYVIDFLLTHHGDSARGKTYKIGKRTLKDKYSTVFPGRNFHTTTTVVRF
jgi:hypothetical protein